MKARSFVSVVYFIVCVFLCFNSMYLSSRINLGRRQRSEQLQLASPDEFDRLQTLVKKILKSPLKILAIDFDRTLIDDDSGSSISCDQLYIRNQFFWLIQSLLKQKWICITSFNENAPTIFNENLGIVTQTIVRRLLNLTDSNFSRPSIDRKLAEDYQILIESYPSRSYGKLEHIRRCIERIGQLSSSLSEIHPYQVAFFDDHPMNIKEAKKHFPSALIPIDEFNRKARTIEPLIPLVNHLLEQSWNDYQKSKNQRKLSRGDR